MMIEQLAFALQAAAPNLSPIGLDWWITLGGWLPGFAAVAIAIVIWIRSARGEKKDE